jgi:hypothetical protein
MYAYMHSPAAGRILICTACARSLGAVRATHPTTLLTQPCATRLRSAVSAVRLGVRFPRRFPQPNASSRLPPPPPASFLCREVVRVRHRDFSDSSAGSPALLMSPAAAIGELKAAQSGRRRSIEELVMQKGHTTKL